MFAKTALARRSEESLGPKNFIDVHVGARVRVLRTARGLSPDQIASCLGTSVQEIDAYETGSLRLGAEELMRLTKFLTVPVSSLFEGLHHGPPRP
jgi:DNA-binding transcriptional regulator YiaG